MALHKTAVNKAWYLFRDILAAEGMSINSFIREYDKEVDQLTVGVVLGAGRKSDDGWENLFIQLKYFTLEQRRIWDEGKDKIPNSHWVPEQNEHGVWQIGFF